MKSALIIRHVPYEGIAGYRAPIEAAGYAVDRIDVADPGFATLDLCAPDLVVSMGGPMGVYETEANPWIEREVAQLARRIAAAAPTLGVCLGSQLIAAALGAPVYPGPAEEIGFAPIALSEAGAASPLRHLAGVPVLHWHGDTFDQPDGVEQLASTASYHQGFRRGAALLALQFHAEMGIDPRFEAWVGGLACASRASALRRDYARLGPIAVRAGQAMIGEWLAGLG